MEGGGEGGGGGGKDDPPETANPHRRHPPLVQQRSVNGGGAYGYDGGADYCHANGNHNDGPRHEQPGRHHFGRKNSNGGGQTYKAEENNVYRLLEMKEKDLELAAELGKALLQRNEELRRKNEELAEEYSNKLEVLEQEKYALRRQLESIEEEYQTVSCLTEENQKLTQDLKDSMHKETQLRDQVKRITAQFSRRRSSMQEHFNEMESLRDEIDHVLARKEELEKELTDLLAERDTLSESLEMSNTSITTLERKHREQELMIRKGQREIEELRSTNHHLLDKLETLSRSRSSSPSCRMSLQSELEMSGSDSEKSMRRQFDVIEELDEFELDDEDEEMTCQESWLDDLGEEVISAYSQLRNMCALIRDRERKSNWTHDSDSMDTSTTTSSASIPTINSLRNGQLTNLVKEIRALILALVRKESKNTGNGNNSLSDCGSCGQNSQSKLEIEKKLHFTIEQVERGSIALKQAELQSKRKEDEILELRSRLDLLKTRLETVEEERCVLRSDLENLSSSRDTMIKKAWDVRDAAVKRKNSAEVELAKARIDIMQANSQLLEAVQQKVSLSEQLDDWQADLQTVLGKKLSESESEKSPPKNLEKKLSTTGANQQTTTTLNGTNTTNMQNSIANNNNNNSKIISFFQRT